MERRTVIDAIFVSAEARPTCSDLADVHSPALGLIKAYANSDAMLHCKYALWGGWMAGQPAAFFLCSGTHSVGDFGIDSYMFQCC